MYVKINHIEKQFKGIPVLKNISFSIEMGEFITLLGPSGCGKSTLLKSIAGLIDIDGGTFTIDEKDITHLPSKDRQVGMVFQSYALFPNLNVFDNIAFGLKMQGLSKEVIAERVNEMIELVDLKGKEKQYPRELSGGQQQRVALARSIVMKPKVLLLDEPLSALDAKIRKNLQIELRNIQQKLGMTMIFVTHDQEEAMSMSDRIVVMDAGSIAQIGTPHEIYTAPANEFVARFIGHYNVMDARTISWLDSPKLIGIRPEVISFTEENQDTNISLKGKIQSISLKGNVLRYEVTIKEEQSLYVDMLHNKSANYQVGSIVTLAIPQKDIVLL